MTRTETLAEAVRAEGADAVILTGEVNLTYALEATGLEGKVIVCADGRTVFLTDGRYIEAAEEKLAPKGITIYNHAGACSRLDWPAPILTELGVQKLMYEDDVLTVSEFSEMRRLLTCRIVPVGNRIAALRSCKSEAEIACIVQAQRIAEAALERLLPELRAGMTEQEAAARLNYYMALGGSEKLSFDTIMLFGENTSRPHGVPGTRELRPGDAVLADFGAVYKGYHSDMTRTFAFGSASDEFRTVYETVRRAQDAAQEIARPGVPCSAMHTAAADVIAAAGYGEQFTHALGHSVGLEIHEMPVASLRCTELLKPGVVMTDEPGIYLPGKFGVRIEDMLTITENGADNLTAFPKELTILPES